MASGTATVATFDASSSAAAITAAESLSIASGDKAFIYVVGSRGYILRFQH